MRRPRTPSVCLLAISLCAGLATSPSPATAGPAVQVSDRFIRLAKRALRDIALEEFKERACGGNEDCRDIADFVVDVVTTDDPDLETVFLQLRDRLLKMGFRRLFAVDLLPDLEGVEDVFWRDFDCRSGQAVLDAFRRDVGECVLQLALHQRQKGACGFAHVGSVLERAGGCLLPEFAAPLATLASADGGTTAEAPVAAVHRVAGVATEFLWLAHDRLLGNGSTSRANDLLLAIAVVDSLHEATKSGGGSDFFSASDRFFAWLGEYRELYGVPLSCAHAVFALPLAPEFRGRPFLPAWKDVVSACCPAGRPAGVDAVASGCPLVTDRSQTLATLAEAAAAAQTGVPADFVDASRRALLLEETLDTIACARKPVLVAAAGVDFLRTDDEEVFGRRMVDLFRAEVTTAFGRVWRRLPADVQLPGDVLKNLRSLLGGGPSVSLRLICPTADAAAAPPAICRPGAGTTGAFDCTLPRFEAPTAGRVAREVVDIVLWLGRCNGWSPAVTEEVRAAAEVALTAAKAFATLSDASPETRRERAVYEVSQALISYVDAWLGKYDWANAGAGRAIRQLIVRGLELTLDVLAGWSGGPQSEEQFLKDVLTALEDETRRAEGWRLHVSAGLGAALSVRFAEPEVRIAADGTRDEESRAQFHLTVLDLYGAAYQWRCAGFYAGAALGGFLDRAIRAITDGDRYEFWRLTGVFGFRDVGGLPLQFELGVGLGFPFTAPSAEEWFKRTGAVFHVGLGLPIDMVFDEKE